MKERPCLTIGEGWQGCQDSEQGTRLAANLISSLLVLDITMSSAGYRVSHANRTAVCLFAQTGQTLPGLPLEKVVGRGAQALQSVVDRSVQSGLPMRVSGVSLAAAATDRRMECDIVPLSESRVLLILADAHQPGEVERGLLSTLDRLNTMLSSLPDPLMSVDNCGRVETWNMELARVSGIPAAVAVGSFSSVLQEQLFGPGTRCLTEAVLVGDVDVLKQDHVMEYSLDGDCLTFEICMPARQGGEVSFFSGRIAPLYGAQGDIAGAVCTMRNVTDWRRLEEELRHLSVTDQLTGLHNRNAFEQELARIALRQDVAFGVLFCDLDGLKFVNDTLGHSVGDQVLRLAAAVIHRHSGKKHLAARVGGDEFAIVVSDAEEDYMSALAVSLRQEVALATNLPDIPVPVSMSVGYAVSGPGQHSVSAVLKAADDNMYREKLMHSTERRRKAVDALLEALERREPDGAQYALRLTELLDQFALELGLDQTTRRHLQLLAKFHNVGTIGIPDSVYLKTTPLTSYEEREIRRHSETGHRIAQYLPDLLPLADDILKHHEWWNGDGYPLGLAGEDIPYTARLFALADALDAMLCDRPYRKALLPEAALRQIAANRSTQFDPGLVDLLLPLMQRYAHSRYRSKHRCD